MDLEAALVGSDAVAGGALGAAQGGTVVFKASASRQAKATTNAYRVARKFKSRIKRLYYYQWRKNNANDFFDAGIVDFGGKLRPAYKSLQKLPKSVWK